MTKKDFIKLAEAIKGIDNKETRDEIAYRVGLVCSESNPRFNWDIWNKACNS